MLLRQVGSGTGEGAGEGFRGMVIIEAVLVTVWVLSGGLREVA